MKKIFLLILFIPVFVMVGYLSYVLLGFALNLLELLPFSSLNELRYSPWWFEFLRVIISTILAFHLSFKVYPFEKKYPAIIIISLLQVFSIWGVFYYVRLFPDTYTSLSTSQRINFVVDIIAYSIAIVLVWIIVISGKGRWGE